MKICPKCNAQLQDDAQFCYACGTVLGDTGAAADNSSQNNAFNAAPDQSVNQATPNYQNYQNQGNQNYQNYQGGNSYQQSYNADPFDHTSEFTTKDISDNKVIAMMPYIMGTLGIIVALLASSTSPYVAFHVRQALKLTVCNVLLTVVTGLLCWTCIMLAVGPICVIILFVVRIICFFQVCGGKAKEPAIVKKLGFLR